VDLVGKGGHVRTVPIPNWVWSVLCEWLTAAGIREGRIFRRVSRTGRIFGPGSRRKLSGTLLSRRLAPQASRSLPLTIFVAHVPVCVKAPVES